ncbi:integrase [Mesorhizobium sp. M00.F.Ca.ET.186.01.1.1]|nr:integrase [bacterium M00.F.Ca.ET.205.01.1.1]TGU52958.1 integrase [bacterium M00.F.Ca.ET.152.01.1.1]TGV35928.1 integrase [Mesorhizobium sp. M00.F.Ca.ET.186.01.1.1]TGZ43510.1 integrase [bacterium M00.F.Ca.ET.162.01.1.1]
MGRNRTRIDPDRYLTLRQGNYHYKRRVPVTVAHLDERAPHVRASLKTDDRALARRKRDLLEAADDALWASLITKGVTDPARRRYEAAVKRVEALDFTFHGAAYFEQPEAFDDLMDRIRVVLAGGNEQQITDPLLGAVEVPKTTVSKAFDIYCGEIVADELIGKSQVQKDQWKKVKRRAVNNFIKLNGDLAMEEITIDHAKKVYRHWLARIAPKEGSATAGASSGNRDLGNMRVLYEAYFKYQGDARRENPFDGLGFSLKKKRSRPPIPTEWIRDTVMKPGNLATLNDEARGILLILIETGARPSEICNLEPHAIRLSNKVPHLSIEPREDPDNPREIKTESSRRLVPLVGVALEAAKRHPAGFPRYRNRENDLSATLNHFLRANALLPTKLHTVYSFRHSFEDRMKEGGIEDELRRLLMGHTVDRPKYGSGGSLDWRRKELTKIALKFDQSIV